jgi:putative transposase
MLKEIIRRTLRGLSGNASSRQAALENGIKEICETRVRCGNRCVHVLLRREAWPINQTDLSARKASFERTAKRLRIIIRPGFVRDRLATGHKIRV